jgi:hypothetical protein
MARGTEPNAPHKKAPPISQRGLRSYKSQRQMRNKKNVMGITAANREANVKKRVIDSSKKYLQEKSEQIISHALIFSKVLLKKNMNQRSQMILYYSVFFPFFVQRICFTVILYLGFIFFSSDSLSC